MVKKRSRVGSWALYAIFVSACVFRPCSSLAGQSPSPSLQSRASSESQIQLTVLGGTANGSAPPANGVLPRLKVGGSVLAPGQLSLAVKPVQVFFVLDAINTPRADLLRSQEALEQWLRSAGENLPYETSILIAADTRPVFRNVSADAVSTWELIKDELYVARIAPSHNAGELRTRLAAFAPGLSRLQDSPQAVGGNERVHISLQALSFMAAAMKDSPAAKLMLWIGPGWPYVHMTGGGYSQQLFDSIVYFDDALREANLVLYALDPTGAATEHTAPSSDALLAMRPGAREQGGAAPLPGSVPGSRYYQAFLAPVLSSRTADPNDMVLPVLALHSGGTVQMDSNDLVGGIARFVADASSAFTVSFPAPRFAGKVTYESLELGSPKAQERLRTRAGFYAH